LLMIESRPKERRARPIKIVVERADSNCRLRKRCKSKDASDYRLAL
jgi:hypothetical protein